MTVDDAHAGVTTVVRGMDLLTSTATQVLIQNQLRPLLAWAQPIIAIIHCYWKSVLKILLKNLQNYTVACRGVR